MGEGFGLATAVSDFRRARYRAALEQILARLRGRSTELLSYYGEVRQKLRATGAVARGLQETPLDVIVGSVGRYVDFLEQRKVEVDPVARTICGRLGCRLNTSATRSYGRYYHDYRY